MSGRAKRKVTGWLVFGLLLAISNAGAEKSSEAMKARNFAHKTHLHKHKPTYGEKQSSSVAAKPLGSEPKQRPSPNSQQQAASHFGQLPLAFEPNMGQSDARVRFFARGPGYTLFLTDTGAVLETSFSAPKMLSQAAKQPAAGSQQLDVLHLRFSGAQNPKEVLGEGKLEGVVNYYIGNDPKKWHTNIPTYSAVEYRELYPGIDLVYHGNPQQLEYDLKVAPGADASQVRLAIEGAAGTKVDDSGNVLIMLAADGNAKNNTRQVVLGRPEIYQTVSGKRREIAGSFVLLPSPPKQDNRAVEVALKLGPYDRRQPLVIDPTLSYSYNAPGGYSTLAEDVSVGALNGGSLMVDSAGEAVLVGITGDLNLPIEGLGTCPLRCSGIYIEKLNSSGSQLVYSTYFGGTTAADGSPSGENTVMGALDSNGDIYIAGQFPYRTADTNRNIPLLPPVDFPRVGALGQGTAVQINRN